MFGSNFIESASKTCAFCNSPDAGAIITHIGAPENSCTYHVNCVATEILQDNCPKCSFPINPRSLEQFKTRVIEPVHVPVVNNEEEVANAKEARALQQKLDLEELEEKQRRLEDHVRSELKARKLQAEFDAEGPVVNPTDNDFDAAWRLHEELNAVPQPPIEQNHGIRRCDLLSYVTRNRLIAGAITVAFVASLVIKL